VDGDTVTYAQAGGKYAWTLQVDLGKQVANIRQANIDFNAVGYAVDYEVYYSPDHIKWTLLIKESNNSKIHSVFQFPPVDARYFQIRSLKPDGPDQKGLQMCIAEIALFQ
jgi:hypothetical protein